MKRAGQVNPRNAVLLLAGGGAVLVLAAQLLAKPGGAPTARAAARPSGSRSAAPESLPIPPRPRLAADPPLRDLFVPLVSETPARQSAPPPAPAAPALPAPAPEPAPSASAPAPAPPAAPAGPSVGDITMLGVVELGERPQVLLRRGSTGESRYFGVGDDAFGFKVQEIRGTDVTLARGGETHRVEMSASVTLEGPGSTATAGSSGFSGRFGGGFRDRGDRGDRGERGERRGDRGDGEGGSSALSGIMSLPTWKERLAKLEQVKAQLEPDRYERLKRFMTERAKQESGN